MPGNPLDYQVGGRSSAGSIVADADFQKLSPQAQQVLKAYADSLQGRNTTTADIRRFQQAMQTDPAFAAAIQEAKEKGALDHPITPFMKGLMIAVGAVATGGILSASGALGGGATTVGAPGPLAAGEEFVAGPIAGGGIAGGNTAELAATMGAGAVKSPSIWKSLLPTIIGAGANVGGTAIAAHANTEAAKIAAAQADKALDLTKEQYALQRQDTAPYRALGLGGVGNLGYLGGIGMDQGSIDKLSKTVPEVPYGQSAPQFGGPNLGGTNTGVATGQTSVLVPVRSPQGQIKLIPNNQVSAAIAAGGQLANRV